MNQQPSIVKLYRLSLSLFPSAFRKRFEAEMIYVFELSLEDARKERGSIGLSKWVIGIFLETFISAIKQQLISSQEKIVKKNKQSLLYTKRVFILNGVIALLILTIPLIGTLVSDEVDWTILDFIVMGLLIYGMLAFFVLLARRTNGRSRVLAAVITMFIFLYVWAELAVGIFFNIGS